MKFLPILLSKANDIVKMGLVTGITIIAILFFKFIITHELKAWLREDGIIENIQAFLFLAAAIGFAITAI
jgi:hypothetical protein